MEDGPRVVEVVPGEVCRVTITVSILDVEQCMEAGCRLARKYDVPLPQCEHEAMMLQILEPIRDQKLKGLLVYGGVEVRTYEARPIEVH
jgi:hypothetical protein